MRIPSCRCRRRGQLRLPRTGSAPPVIEVTTGIGKTGVVGLLRNGEGPTVMLRADMDALPVEEATGLPYASKVTATDREGKTVPVGCMPAATTCMSPGSSARRRSSRRRATHGEGR